MTDREIDELIAENELKQDDIAKMTYEQINKYWDNIKKVIQSGK